MTRRGLRSVRRAQRRIDVERNKIAASTVGSSVGVGDGRDPGILSISTTPTPHTGINPGVSRRRTIKGLVLLFFFLWVCRCYAFGVKDVTVDEKMPYRIYVGENKKVDWVDVKRACAYGIDGEGVCTAGDDLSPIEELLVNEWAGVVLIKKRDSVWKLYWSDEAVNLRLYLVYPELPTGMSSEEAWVRTYRRGK